MLKAIFLFILALTLTVCVAPFIFVYQIIVTALFSGGIVAGWNGVASYIMRVAADGLDQTGATILYKVRDLTISSYTHVLDKKGKKGKAKWFRKFIDFFFGKKHCQDSAMVERDEMYKSIKILEDSL